MKRNRRKDIAVFVSIAMTLALCVLSLVLIDELKSFENTGYSDLTPTGVSIMDMISPGEYELYYEYKEEFEARTFQVNLSFILTVISLATTIFLAIGGQVHKTGLDVIRHD